MKNGKIMVGIIGPNVDKCSREAYHFGIELGEKLIDAGLFIVCGGRFGMMEAVCKGAHNSKAYKNGCTIGILPSEQKSDANSWVDIAIPTGIGIARNIILVNSSDIIIAVAGGSGTLSELAFSWQKNKPVICVTQFGGWSAELAGFKVDSKDRELFIEANTPEEVIEKIKSLL